LTMTMMPDYPHVSVNGRLIPAKEACIPLTNLASFHGFGVYESIQVEQGVPFLLEKHISRLFQSASLINMQMPGTETDVANWALELIGHDNIEQALLRIRALGVTNDSTDEPLVYILPRPARHYPQSYYRQGVWVITFAGARPLPRCKSLNTLVNFLAMREARRKGAHEAILLQQGVITEGSRTNIFAVCDGQLLTTDEYHALPGITRDLALKLAAEAGIEVREKVLLLEEAHRWQEFFITSTSRHIIPVVRIDELTVGDGTVGPLTRELMARFAAYYADYLKSHAAPARLPTGAG
jgi:branched-chain amino acid aminotransferase